MSGRIEGFDDLAIITVPARTAPSHDINATGTAEVLVSRTSRGGWASIVNEDYFWEADYSFHAADPRPVVVIDPEDRLQVEDLLVVMRRRGWTALDDDAPDDMQAALREFANPTPPKPDEPTGLGAVVEDAHGEQYVRTTNGAPWFSCGLIRFDRWSDVPAVRVLSEGVTA